MEDEEWLSWLAFDPRAASRLFAATPGRELAARLAAAAPGAYGPLEADRGEVVERLAALGERTPVEARSTDVRALELCALATAEAFAAGDEAAYWDDRVLTVFTLDDAEPRIPDSELDVLDGCDSVLHAMLEVLPFAEPPHGEGAILYSIGDAELAPLAPWVAPGQPYGGAIYTLQAARLVSLLRSLDEKKLARRVDRFFAAWYRATHGAPEGDAFVAWRRAVEERGRADTLRFFTDWAELSALLETAAARHLQVALLFYAPIRGDHDR